MNIVVICGGFSTEREVSLASGSAVASALKELGHTVSLADPSLGKDQKPADSEVYETKPGRKPPSIGDYDYGKALEMFNSPALNEAEMAFIALHGTFGEDGTIQALLEAAGLKYTGSKLLASALAMDKDISKKMFQEAGIPVLDWTMVRDGKVFYSDEDMDFPMVVKPNDQGSTVGFGIANNSEELDKAAAAAAKYSNHVMVEKYVEGRELTVAILGKEALPIVEIKPKHKSYDYESKYTPGMSEYVCPADLPEQVEVRVQLAALKAFNALGCRHYARIDFLIDNDDRFYCLEVNTLPGLTKTSLVPKAAKAVGMSFKDLVETIVELAD
ncbi:MAG: D-alanine--D-alanine ligase [Candidatus Marinimicrobia bacterium]|nr:D-alanine--D-alanine ligase [Candidatus Neomarinimicrobiota bacterium]